jgi:hypothetical protein
VFVTIRLTYALLRVRLVDAVLVGQFPRQHGNPNCGRDQHAGRACRLLLAAILGLISWHRRRVREGKRGVEPLYLILGGGLCAIVGIPALLAGVLWSISSRSLVPMAAFSTEIVQDEPRKFTQKEIDEKIAAATAKDKALIASLQNQLNSSHPREIYERNGVPTPSQHHRESPTDIATKLSIWYSVIQNNRRSLVGPYDNLDILLSMLENSIKTREGRKMINGDIRNQIAAYSEASSDLEKLRSQYLEFPEIYTALNQPGRTAFESAATTPCQCNRKNT